MGRGGETQKFRYTPRGGGGGENGEGGGGGGQGGVYIFAEHIRLEKGMG